MKTLKTSLITLAIAGSLGSSFALLAETTKNKPFEGLLVEDVVVIEQLPTEVQSGSVRVKDDDDAAMASQARITASEAAKIATTALPGKIIEIELEDEDDYLIWEAKIVGANGHETELKIDAGNGRLLAAEKEDDSWWKFWEDNDDD